MFEATLSFYAISGDAAFLDMAEECLDLFRTVFLDSRSGLVLEYFDADWVPVLPRNQVIEPGHMVEWVFLLSEYERVTGKPSGVDLRALFDKATAFGLDGDGMFLLDQFALDGTAITTARRLWPQTELLKAARVLASAGDSLPMHLAPREIWARFCTSYLDTPVVGGWYDRFDARGKLISTYMPSSSFYHLYSALTTLL